MGLSESDKKCLDDTEDLSIKTPELEQAAEELMMSLEMKMEGLTSMSLGYSKESADAFQAVCESSLIGGIFTLTEEEEFDCDMLGKKVNVKMTNIVTCTANTDECQDMNKVLLMEDLWSSQGMKCNEKTGEIAKSLGLVTPSSTQINPSKTSDSKLSPIAAIAITVCILGTIGIVFTRYRSSYEQIN